MIQSFRAELQRSWAGMGLCLLACVLMVSACSNRAPGHEHRHQALPGFEAYTGPQEGIWPPQPAGVSNLRAFQSERLTTAMSDVAASQALAELLADKRVKTALGERFAHIQTDQRAVKGEPSEERFIFFSHSHNQTVELVRRGAALELKRFDPSTYQPPEGQTEAAAAVRLAEDLLLGSGFSRVAELEGWAMLAFQGREAGGGGFHDSRVLYVTFTAGEDSLPEFYAYVDLSAQRVLEYGPIKGQ